MKLDLQLSTIKYLAKDTETFLQGEKLFYASSTLGCSHITEDGEKLAKISVLDDEQTYNTVLYFDLKGNLVSDQCSCKVPGCAHVVCAMLNFTQETNASVSKNKAKELKNMLTNVFSKNLQVDIGVLNKEKIQIQPIVDFETMTITFRIGSKKHYLIKNITEFLQTLSTESNYYLTQNFHIRNSLSNYSTNAQSVIQYLKYELEYNFYNQDNVKFIELTSLNIDKTFELLLKFFESGEKIYTKQPNGNLVELYLDKDFVENIYDEFLYELDFTDNNILLKNSKFDYETLQGYRQGYIFKDDTILRVPNDFFNCLTNINETFIGLKSDEINFNYEEISDFLSFVFPYLKKYNLIENTYIDKLFQFGYYDLVTKIYFDIKKKNVLANVVFCYGDDEIPYYSLENVPFRNQIRELEIIKTLNFFNFEDTGTSFAVSKDNDIFDFITAGFDTFRSLAEVYITDAYRNYLHKLNEVSPSVSIRSNNNLLSLDIEFGDIDIAEMRKILDAFTKNKKFYRLENGEFINLQKDDVKELVELLHISEVEDDKFYLPFSKSFLIDNFSELNISKDAAFVDMILSIKNSRTQSLDLPEVNLDLRSYQLDGIKWLNALYTHGLGGILADDMGLGKTIQTISLLSKVKLDQGSLKALIVVPTSVLYNWEQELVRTANNLTYTLVFGTQKTRSELIEFDSDVYITTFDTVRRDIKFYTHEFDILIVDEAQYIKNHNTQTSKAIKKINRKSTFALTGTPIENSLGELWSIFNLCLPSLLGSFNSFNKNYIKSIVQHDNNNVMSLLKNQISPFILRRFKADVLTELPDKIESTITCDMTDEQENIYNTFLLEARGEIYAGLQNHTMDTISVLSKITRLRQLACHPQLVNEDYLKNSGKLDATLELLESVLEQGHRVLLFSQFTSMLQIISDKLTNMLDEPHFYLDGKTSSKNRIDMSARFNNGENNIFLISLKAGGVGLNLTGADVVIHFDPWWNPSVMEQATARAYRFGQKNTVQVFNIIARNSIEEKIVKLQESKKSIIDNVINDNTQTLGRLTEDDIKWIFDL